MSDKTKHGGKRRGAGRKPRFGVPMKATSVRLPPEWIEQLKSEFGSLQAAIETLVARYLEGGE